MLHLILRKIRIAIENYQNGHPERDSLYYRLQRENIEVALQNICTILCSPDGRTIEFRPSFSSGRNQVSPPIIDFTITTSQPDNTEEEKYRLNLSIDRLMMDGLPQPGKKYPSWEFVTQLVAVLPIFLFDPMDFLRFITELLTPIAHGDQDSLMIMSKADPRSQLKRVTTQLETALLGTVVTDLLNSTSPPAGFIFPDHIDPGANQNAALKGIQTDGTSYYTHCLSRNEMPKETLDVIRTESTFTNLELEIASDVA